jgi:hypothetical protein
MLYAIGTPLALGNFAENRRSLVQQLVNDSILGFSLKVFKCMLTRCTVIGYYNVDKTMTTYLHDEGASLMTGKRSPFAFQGFVDAMSKYR